MFWQAWAVVVRLAALRLPWLMLGEADLFNGTIIKMNIGGIDYFRTITDTANSTLTFGALPGAKGSGNMDSYGGRYHHDYHRGRYRD